MLPKSAENISANECWRGATSSGLSRSRPNWAVGAMSNLPPLATEQRTSQVTRFVPETELTRLLAHILHTPSIIGIFAASFSLLRVRSMRATMAVSSYLKPANEKNLTSARGSLQGMW
jgi:hypothetical protein